MIPIAGQGVRAAQTAARHADEAVDVAASIASKRTKVFHYTDETGAKAIEKRE